MDAADELIRLASLPARLREQIQLAERPGATPCWVWTGRHNRNGYGRAWCERTKREPVAHRLLYERLIGPIRPGLILDHICRVRACCNPWHMEPVTVAINTARGEAVLFHK